MGYHFKNIIKNNLLLIFCFPIFANTLLNLFQNFNLKDIQGTNFAKLGSFIIGTLFFLHLSNYLNNLFSLGSKSLSLVLFFTSYFFFDVVLLFLSKKMSFTNWVILISLFWCILVLIKSKNIYEILRIILFFSILKFYNMYFITDILDNSKYQELNTDVPVQWFKIAKMIYENNYFYALEQNLITGQGLFPSYTQALLLEIGFGIERFQFIQINSFLFISFSILLITDLNISKKNKLLSSILLIFLVLNNDWLNYLLFNSLMIEGIVSFFICVYLFNFIHMFKNKNINSVCYFLSFGVMILSKNFISLLCLLLIIFSLLILKNKINFIAGFIIYSFNLFYQSFYFSRLQNFAYTSEINFKSIFFDFIYLKNLNFTNIVNIIKQFLIDTPTSYLVLLFLIVNFINLYRHGLNLKTENLIFGFVLLNYFFVNLLYISYWRNIEFESSYRYLISSFHLIFTSLIFQLSNFEKVK